MRFMTAGALTITLMMSILALGCEGPAGSDQPRADAGPITFDVGPRDAGPPVDDAAQPDADDQTTPGASFATLEKLLRDKVSSGAISGFAVQIFDGADDGLIFESAAGICASAQSACPSGDQPFTVDLVTGTASSSKWVTSTVLLAALDSLVEAGRIPNVAAALDTTVGEVIGARCAAGDIGRGAAVTFRQLLAFTSGLQAEHDCVGNARYDLQQCACAILFDSAANEVDDPNAGTARNHAHPPGTTYKYGSTHQVVAAALLEVATEGSFASLYERLVRTPSGISADYANATNISGSLRASVRDYARYVRGVYRSGGPGGLLSADAVAEQERSQMPAGVVYRATPQPGLEYGLNTWRWCYQGLDPEFLLALGQQPSSTNLAAALAAQDTSCAEVHQQGHGGKGGYQPFIDRKRGIYGVFAMREPSPGGGADYSAAELALTAVVRLYAGEVADALERL